MIRSFPSAVLLLLPYFAIAQQFSDYVQPYDTFGFSDACFEAVNTTLSSCPSWLIEHAGFDEASFDILPEPALESLCVASCRAELTSLKNIISAACTQTTDVMVPPDGVAYPATFITDRLLYSMDLSCLKDSSGRFCDLVVAPWAEQTEPYTTAQNCSDCSLAAQAKQLSSPFGYGAEDAADFSSVTSSCGATQYSYVSPTPYAINATADSPARPSCTASTYVVQEDDSCNLIAEMKGVSTESLISENGFDIVCNLFPPPGTTICIPSTCRTRQLEMMDTCESIVDEEGITMGQLLAWNPIISPGCGNLHSWRGRFLCVSPALGTVTIPDGAVITAAPIPTNTQGESVTNCGQWYTIAADDNCASISVAFGITLADFFFLNPQVASPSCNNLWLGYAYCVKPVGSIETYPGYEVTVPSTSFTRPPEPTVPADVPAQLPPNKPRAAGTLAGCFAYGNAWDEAFIAGGREFMNSCDHFATLGGSRLEEVLAWNPSLSEQSCRLDQRYSYCITRDDPTEEDDEEPETTTTTAAVPTTTTQAATTTSGNPAPPAETQPGAIASCKKWHIVSSGDGCWAISDQYGIDLGDFYKWNPGVRSDCAFLWLDYAVCVGI